MKENKSLKKRKIMILKCSSQIMDKITVWSIINMNRTVNEKKNIPEGMVLIPEGLFLMGSTKQDIDKLLELDRKSSVSNPTNRLSA